METRRHNVLLSLFLLFLLCRPVAAQDPVYKAPFLEQAEKNFEFGLLQFERGAWNSAAIQFESIIRELPINHRTTAAYVMAARAQHFDGKHSPALRLIEELHRNFPESSYLAEACLIAGDAALAAGSRSAALQWYVRSWLSEDADRTTLTASIQKLQPAQIPAGELRPVRKLMEQAEIDSTLVALLQGQTPTVPARSVGTTAQTGAPAAQPPAAPVPVAANPDAPVRIVAAFPLHEKDPRRAAVVRDLRDGVLAALDLHREGKKHMVEFELIDNSDKDSLRRALDRLDRDNRVMVLLAGAFSDDAEIVARMAAEKGMVVLLPTATADGLSREGSNIFQLNTPILQRARLLADFSYLELDAQEAIVIAPGQTYARSMAETFMTRAKELGMTVRHAGWYGAGGENATDICRRIADSGVKNGILFAPVQSRDDIVAVLKGMSDAQLSLPVVGGGNWNHPDIIASHARDLTLYFESDVDADTTADAYGRLSSAFGQRSPRPLSREALFGADAMRIALAVTGPGPCTRKEVRKRIADVFEGLRAPVNFLEQRVNAAMNIIECRRGVPRKHEAFHSK